MFQDRVHLDNFMLLTAEYRDQGYYDTNIDIVGALTSSVATLLSRLGRR